MAKSNETNSISTNMITNGTKITGDISCDSDIRIEGELEGSRKREISDRKFGEN
jgi:cytoskeletal protein CcmA (bactofilin family)